MRATILRCVDCYALKTFIQGVGTGKRPVPGTGKMDCGHPDIETIGEVPISQLVHVALSTLLRRPDVLADRDAAHMIQEWLKVSALDRRTFGLPWALIDGHDVSSEGLATARILARTMSAIAAPSDAVYWRAAANIMRVRM